MANKAKAATKSTYAPATDAELLGWVDEIQSMPEPQWDDLMDRVVVDVLPSCTAVLSWRPQVVFKCQLHQHDSSMMHTLVGERPNGGRCVIQWAE